MTPVQISVALQAHLATLPPALDTVVENGITYVPVANKPYQRVNVLFAPPENPTLGDGFYRETGVLQVTLCYPAGQGAGPALTRAQELRVWFARGLFLPAGTAIVRVVATPTIGPPLVEGDRWCIPVRIRWTADIHPFLT